jgi:hypothetical protein
MQFRFAARGAVFALQAFIYHLFHEFLQGTRKSPCSRLEINPISIQPI